MSPDLSVIIPVYNRGELVRHTLASVRAASPGLRVETIVVDDGSTIPVADDLARLGVEVSRIIRQENKGLLFARLAGLEAATGRHVLFLDSDDLVSSDKLSAHVRALDDTGAEVTYTDVARQNIDPASGPAGAPALLPPLADTSDAAEFFIKIQPAPHSPAFRTAYLRNRVASAPFPPSPLYNAVAEIWFYHLCAPFPARVAKSAGLAIGGSHPGERLTGHWERLAVASLAVQEAFARTCPLDTAAGRRARTLCATKCFNAWRALPRDFSPAYSRRLLRLWREAPTPAPTGGGRGLQIAAGLVGPVAAANAYRRLRGKPYATCRTMDDASFSRLLSALPNP
jgi:glycosyltransferase involved in cell wall biosynthesis